MNKQNNEIPIFVAIDDNYVPFTAVAITSIKEHINKELNYVMYVLNEGISEENKNLIFDRFNQVIDKSAELKGGSGLGLTIFKQLITLHGGDIYVESEVGVVSEFIIILPVNND